MLITNSSTAKQEEKQEERGSCQPLQAILVNKELVMKILKVLMLLILGLFVYLSLSHLLKLETPSIGAYWLAIFTIGSFIVYFLVFFLDLEIISKWVSIKRKMNTLENKQKQLSKISTSLYKLLILFKSHMFFPAHVDKNFELFDKIQHKIEQYINDTSVYDLERELKQSYEDSRKL